MPDRAYHPRHTPPSRWDHVLAHPGAAVFAAWWAFCGAMILLSAFSSGFEPTRTLAALSAVRTIGLGGTILVGGALVLWGTVTTHSRLKMVWTALRAGYVLSAGAWAGYLAATLAVDSLAVTSWSLAAANILFAALSLTVTVREERRGRGVAARTGLYE